MKNIYKIIFTAALIVKATAAYANVAINPYYIVFDGDSKDRNKQVMISNTAHEPKTFRIKFVNYKQLPDGSYEEISEAMENAPFANPYLVVSPNQTVLDPGKNQTIRIQRKPMLNAPDGEYVSRLMVQEIDTSNPNKKPEEIEGMKIEARALYAITIPVIIQKGTLTASGKIENPKVIKKEGQKVLTAEVKREGTKSLFANISVKNEKSEEIGRLNGLRVYLTTADRFIEIPLQNYKSGEKLSVELLDAENDEEISTKVIP